MTEPSARVLVGKLLNRARSRPQLSDAVLGLNVGAYFWHRTRFIVPRVVLRTLLHGVELYLLSRLVPWQFMSPYFILRGASILAMGAHWGWLEGLREQIRRLHQARRFADARTVTGQWLIASTMLSAFSFLLAGLWMYLDVDGFQGFSVFDAFALACAFRFSVETLARTYHAMIYSVKRVYRPLSSLLVPDALEPIALVALFPRWGLWSFAFAATLGGAIRAWQTFAWSNKAILGTRLSGPLRPRRLPHNFRSYLQSWQAGVAGLSGQIDAILLVALASAADRRVVALIYLARPLLAGAQGAFRTFYFDLKRLEYSCPPFLLKAFSTRLLQFASIVGGLTGLSIAALVVFQTGSHGGFLLILGGVVFGILRGLLSVVQVQAFVARRYIVLMVVSVVMFVVVSGLVRLALPFGPLLAAIDLMLGMSVWFLLLQSSVRGRQHAPAFFSEWLEGVSSHHGPLLIFSATVDRRAKMRRLDLLKELRAKYPELVFLAKGREEFLAWLPVGQAGNPNELIEEVTLLSAGGLACVKGKVFDNGPCAVAGVATAGDGFLPSHREKEIRQAQKLPVGSHDALLKRLQIEIPDIQVGPRPSALLANRRWPRERLRHLAGFFGKGRGKGLFMRNFPHNRPNALFIICLETAENRKALEKWRPILESESLAYILRACR